MNNLRHARIKLADRIHYATVLGGEPADPNEPVFSGKLRTLCGDLDFVMLHEVDRRTNPVDCPNCLRKADELTKVGGN